MKLLVYASLIALLTSCSGGTGFNSVRNVDESNLHGQSISAVVGLLGAPYGYYVAPDGHEKILTYNTTVQGGSLTTGGCILLLGLAGSGGDCQKGGDTVQQCVALHFGADSHLVEIDRPQFFAGPCSTKSDDRFLPATREPIEAISHQD